MQSSSCLDLQTNEQICMEKEKLRRSLLNEWVQSLGWGDPREANGSPLQYSHLENPAEEPSGHKESDAT